MTKVQIAIPPIPHGHGLSFKKGVADGLLDSEVHAETCHETNRASYRRGVEVGVALRSEIAPLVKE
jgi:hypothetical protein